MGFGCAFPADGVVPSSARESFVSRWPARETPCDPRQARPFRIQKPNVKPKGHVIGYQSHVVWPHPRSSLGQSNWSAGSISTLFQSMPIARASVAAGRPHDRLRIGRGEVAVEAELQRS